MAIKNFRDLDVWRLGREVVVAIYEKTVDFPKHELYSLVSQMRKAAISIPSNIAEGFNRFHNAEYRQFLYVALGSCAELETQLEVASDLGYLEDIHKEELVKTLQHEAAMLRNLIKKL